MNARPLVHCMCNLTWDMALSCADRDLWAPASTPQVEVSLQPWRAFKPDGVILFSDILTPFAGMNIPFDIVTVRLGGPTGARAPCRARQGSHEPGIKMGAWHCEPPSGHQEAWPCQDAWCVRCMVHATAGSCLQVAVALRRQGV